MADPYAGALEAVDRILNRGGGADDVLRAVVGVVHERAGFPWAGIAFVEEDGLLLGPQAGEATAAEASHPVAFQGERVAELQVSPAPHDEAARAFVERVALLISPYCRSAGDASPKA